MHTLEQGKTMADKSNPLESLLKAQREAMQGFTEAAQNLVGAGSSSSTASPAADLMGPLAGLSGALGNLAASSIMPLQELFESQRQFADTMANFAEMHRQMADLLDAVATRQRSAVDAASALLGPIAALGNVHQ
jgi:hypothetical protein